MGFAENQKQIARQTADTRIEEGRGKSAKCEIVGYKLGRSCKNSNQSAPKAVLGDRGQLDCGKYGGKEAQRQKA